VPSTLLCVLLPAQHRETEQHGRQRRRARGRPAPPLHAVTRSRTSGLGTCADRLLPLQGASASEVLIEACRRNNTELLTETLDGKSEDEIARLLNETTTVMGNHLYHEAASRGNCASAPLPTHPLYSPPANTSPLFPSPVADEIIDLLLDQPGFECDPVNRLEGDTPLHAAVRWINGEPEAQRAFGASLVDMMLEAGSNPRLKNKGGLTALQLVDPRNAPLRDAIQKHEYALLNAGDFVDARPVPVAGGGKGGAAPAVVAARDESDDDAEFSGSDEEERGEWERRRREKRKGR